MTVAQLGPTMVEDDSMALIDKDMKKKDLCAKAGISPASVTKLGHNGNVSTAVLLKICTALDCGVGDIMEITADE